MFDNIIGQDQIVSRLTEDVTQDHLPHSVLFFGEAFSGKSSTALELARVISCEHRERGQWGCQCRSCRLQRLLIDSDVLFLGPRYFHQEIRGTGEVFRRMDETFARYMLIRSVRRLLRRFDPVLWEGEEQKIKKATGSVEKLKELISEIEPEEGPIDKDTREKIVGDICELTKKVTSSVNLSHIPIHQVRNAGFWAHTSGIGNHKFLIIEGAETMQESARNAMLKLLEEPPEHLYIIMLTVNKGAIIPTIQSRVRQYGFASRDHKKSMEVLTKIFREDSREFRSLNEYFYAFDFSLDVLRNETELFLSNAMDTHGGTFHEQPFTLLKEKNTFVPFLKSITAKMGELIRNPAGDSTLLTRIEKWNSEINRIKLQVESYNQNHYLLLEKLFNYIRET